MLFSAGTFLYVATVHVLPEVTNGEKLMGVDLLLIIVGTVMPLLLGLISHDHGHSHGGSGHVHGHGEHAGM